MDDTCQAKKKDGNNCTYKAKSTRSDGLKVCGVHGRVKKEKLAVPSNLPPFFIVHVRDNQEGIPTISSSTSLACYDLDHTIIKPIKGRFCESDNDWEFVKGMKEKMVGHHVNWTVVFTNQAGVSTGKVSIETLKKRFANIVAKVGIPMTFVVSTMKGRFRKPHTGMWHELLSHFGMSHDHQEIRKNSFYVGDAAGRFAKKGRKKDFSCSDRMFANNIGIKFFTPEEFIQNSLTNEPHSWYDPRSLMEMSTQGSLKNVIGMCQESSEQEMVILVGAPGSGKSSLASRFESYVVINKDTSSSAKCLRLVKSAFKEGKSVVVDNTNGRQSSRQVFLSIAEEFQVHVRCVWIDVERKLAEHLNHVRVECGQRPLPVPDVVYHTYYKYFDEPTEKEGFASVIKWWEKQPELECPELYYHY